MAIKQRSKSLKSRDNKLSNGFYQLKVLCSQEIEGDAIPKFVDKVKQSGQTTMRPDKIEIFQINIGKLCNQTCAHCHVDAGPDRKEENIDRATLETCLEIIAKHDIPKVDITGGAPEMNPHFRWFVEECSKMGKLVMDRCNLTILRANPKYHDLPGFFAKNNVQLASITFVSLLILGTLFSDTPQQVLEGRSLFFMIAPIMISSFIIGPNSRTYWVQYWLYAGS